MKIGIYCYLIADILAKHFQKCLLSGPYNFCQKLTIPLVVMATERLYLLKYIVFKKSIPQKLLGQ